MKKLIAVLMAMMLVFSCVPALAEESTAPMAINLPSFTVSSEVVLDEEQIMTLLSSLGMPEETAGMVQMFLPMLNGISEKTVFADMGLQFDLQMKGHDILSVVGELSDKGIALGTNLLPSYVLTLKTETIEKLVEQIAAQFQSEAGSLNMELIQQAAEKAMGYAMEMVAALQNAVSFSEPVKGEYADLIEGVVFNTEQALSVDLVVIQDALKQLAAKLLSDEAIKAALDSVTAMVPGASFDPAKFLSSITEAGTENMPEVSGLMYTITDDDGYQTAVDNLVIVNVTAKEGQDPSGNTITYVYVAEAGINITAEVPAQEVYVQINIEQADAGLTMDIALSVPGFDGEAVLTASMTETGIALDGALYINDAETPILACYETFDMTGERTKTAADADKQELAIESLMDSETSGEAIGSLMMDLLINGVGGVMNNIKTVLPEQGAVIEQMVSGLMSMFMGGGATEAVPAE